MIVLSQEYVDHADVNFNSFFHIFEFQLKIIFWDPGGS